MNSGNGNTNNYSGTWMRLDWWIVEQNVSENYSAIRYVLKTERSKSGYTMGGNTKLIINDNQVHFDGSRRRFYNGTEIASGDFKIYHDGEGRGYVGVYMEMAVYANGVNVTGGFRHNLDDIARKATFMYEPPNIVDKVDGSIDGPIAITNPAGLRTLLEIEMLGGQRYFATENIEAGKWYYLLNDSEERKTEFRKLLKNKANTDLNWRLTTFANNGSVIGYDLRTGKKAIIEEVKPDFSNFTLIENNQKVKDLLGNKTNEFIQRQSEVYVNISKYNHMKPKKYAEPKRYIVSCGDTLYYNMDSEKIKTDRNLIYDKESLTLSGDVDFNVDAEDTRGFKKRVTKKVKVHEYFKPTINAVVRRRNNFDDLIEIKVDGKYPRVLDGQAFKLKLYYRKVGDNSFTYSKSLNITASNGKYSLNRSLESIYLNQANDYELKLALDSYFESTEEIYRINKGKAIFFISSNEEKVYENENLIVGQNIASGRIENGTFSIEGDGEYHVRTIPLNSKTNVGDKIEIINNQTMARIKKGIKKVRVDAYIVTENRPFELWVKLIKNRKKYSEAVNSDEDYLMSFRSNIDKWFIHSISGVIVPVKENDIITFEVGKWTGGGSVDLKLTGGYFTVQAVE